MSPIGSFFSEKNSRGEAGGDSKVVHLSAENFDDTIRHASAPVLVDFWAPWCMPCRMMGPVIEELAAEYDGRAIIAKLNTDESQEIAIRYGIRGIPTLLIFKDGEEFDRLVGVTPKAKLKKRLDAAIG